MRRRILQCIGIPTGIGMGRTKTLAKLANYVAKTSDRKPGSYPADLARVCNLDILPAADLEAVFQATEVDEVWGIGRRISKQLHDRGINNVHQLVQMDPATVRRLWSVVLERTVRELQGQACIALEDTPPPKQEIAHTRSFGQPVRDLHQLCQAVTEYASAAALKLRRQNGRAGQISVFVHTSPFRPPPHYGRNVVVPLRRPAADTHALVTAALTGLRAIYRPGFDYIKAGVMLMDLRSSDTEQGELDLEPEPVIRGHLMQSLDSLNDRFGRGTVTLGSAGTGGPQRAWSMKQNLLTPAYTTSWADMPVARA